MCIYRIICSVSIYYPFALTINVYVLSLLLFRNITFCIRVSFPSVVVSFVCVGRVLTGPLVGKSARSVYVVAQTIDTFTIRLLPLFCSVERVC